jgi:hypothetical protein
VALMQVRAAARVGRCDTGTTSILQPSATRMMPAAPCDGPVPVAAIPPSAQHPKLPHAPARRRPLRRRSSRPPAAACCSTSHKWATSCRRLCGTS